jgi:ribosomal protein L17
MLEDIDEALHHARERARQHEELRGQHSEVTARLDSTRAQIGDLEGRLRPVDEGDALSDTATVLGMVRGLRSQADELVAQLHELDRRLAGFEDAPREFAAALTRKAEALRGTSDPRAPELADVAARIAAAERARDGYEAAYASGTEARRWVNAMRGNLDVARRHSSRDLGGRGMDNILTNVAKQRSIRDADEAADRSKEELTAFARRLADIGINADLKLDGIAGNWASDVLFDNFLTDAVKHKEIVMTGAQADDMARWLTEMTNWLRERSLEHQRERDELLSRREKILLGDTGPGRPGATPGGPALRDDIDHGVRAARERLRRHEQLSRRHAALTPRLEAIVGRLRDLKERLSPLEARLGRQDTVSFTGLLAMLSAPDAGARRTRIEAESLRLVTSAHRGRQQQLFGELRQLAQEMGALEPADGEFETARGRQGAALRGHPNAGDLAEMTASIGDLDAELKAYDETATTAAEAAAALGAVLHHFGRSTAPPGPGSDGADGQAGHEGQDPAAPAAGFAAHALHEADRAAWQAQRALDVLAGRLAGLGFGEDPEHPLPETTWFADALFDHVVSDLTAHRNVVTAHERVTEAEIWATQLTEWLRARHGELSQQRAELYATCARLAG